MIHAQQFLRGLETLPQAIRQTIPLLNDVAALCQAPPRSNTEAAGSWGPLGGRLERRYRRICFVHHELNRLNFAKAKPGAVFDDFVFEQTDFSVYRRIPPEDAPLFSEAGLVDYTDDFFETFANLNRKTAGGIISGAYIQDADGSLRLRDEKLLHNPLFLSIMRNVHTSLDFAPLFSREELLEECTGLPGFDRAQDLDELYRGLITALDNGGMIHRDGMETTLTVSAGETSAAYRPPLILRGTFYPHQKPYTITLVEAPAGMPFPDER